MNNVRTSTSRVIAFAIATAIALSGCGSKSGSDMMLDGEYVKPGETVSSDSKWINSAIDGSLDETVQVSIKDDFYTAVNEEWNNSITLDKNNCIVDEFQNNSQEVTRRKLAILSGEDREIDMSNWSADKDAELNEDMIKHDMELVERFGQLAGDWDLRNAKGVEPLRPYIERLMAINDMDSMTEFIGDPSNIVANQFPLVTIEVKTYEGDPDNYHVIIGDSLPDLILPNTIEYYALRNDSGNMLDATEDRVTYLLTRLGYNSSDIKSILTNNYKLECALVNDIYPEGYKTDDKFKAFYDKDYSIDDIKNIQGDYPLATLVDNRGLGDVSHYKIYNDNQIKNIARLYKKSNLEQIKSYYIVHFLVHSIDLLDREAYERNKQIISDYDLDINKKSDQLLPTPDEAKSTDNMTEEEKETAILFNDYINVYMSEPMETVYIAKYTTPEMKQDLEELIDKIKSVYKVMLASNTAKGADFVNKATKKLDNMVVRVLYPDKFTDYSELSFSDSDDYSLLDAVEDISEFNLKKESHKADTPVDRSEWDLIEMPTTAVAAYNKLPDNSINICEGILATDFMYSLDHEDEVNMGRLGMIVAHEISHAFDQNGLRFDENGHTIRSVDFAGTMNDAKDQLNISRYYSSIMPYPGASTYNGGKVVNEALADLGGVKCMMMLALDKTDFDYDLFFRSYAQLWRQKTVFIEVWDISKEDVHPLNFMRTNTIVQQFDKFLEIYDIKPGDGMYLDPKDRIVYW